MAIKYLQIDSFEKTDTNALFEALCDKACDIPVIKGKMLVRPKLTKEQAASHIADLDDLLVLVKVYDIPFSFKVTFMERVKGELKTEQKAVPVFDDALKVCDVYKHMTKQSEEITNPDLIDVVQKKNQVTPIESKREDKVIDIDPGNIPDFM